MNIFALIVCMCLISGALIRIPLYQGITIYPHDICIGFMCLYWFIKNRNLLYTHDLTLITPLKYFLFIALLSNAINIGQQSTTGFLVGVAYCIRFFFYTCMYIIVSKEPKVHWDRYLYWAGAVFSILGVTQYVLYPDLRNLSYAGWDPHFYRLFSTILDPNFAGIIIVVTFFLGIYMYQELRYRYLILFVQCMILVSLILTLSRSSWIAFIFPFIWFIWKKRIWYLMGILAVFIIALFFLPLPYKQITPVLRQESSMARLNNWIFSIRLIQKKPILGYGFNLLGSHKPVSLVYDGMQLSHSSSGLDNSFLFVFATTGIVGGIAWIYLIYTLWHIKISDTQKKRSLLHIFRMSLVAIGIHSLFINSQFFPWIMIWVWTLAGVIEHSKRLRNSMK